MAKILRREKPACYTTVHKKLKLGSEKMRDMPSLQAKDLPSVHPYDALNNGIESVTPLIPGYDRLAPSRTLISNFTSPPRGIIPFTTA